MKVLKKTSVLLLTVVILAAVCALPVMAESLGDITYYPLAGYNPGTENNGNLYSYGGYDIIVSATKTFNTSIMEISESSWLQDNRNYYENRGYEVVTANASYTNFGGRDYLEFSTVLQYGSKSWNILKYTTIYNGYAYQFFYRSGSFDSAGLQGFYNMVSGVTFAGDYGKISIYVNGAQVYPDSDPVIENDRTLVPIRAVAEALGYTVGWDASSKCVTMTKGNFDVQVMVDSTWITQYIDGQVSNYGQMDVPAKILSGRTYIPLRAVAEAMGCSVDWDGGTRSVFITGGGVG